MCESSAQAVIDAELARQGLKTQAVLIETTANGLCKKHLQKRVWSYVTIYDVNTFRSFCSQAINHHLINPQKSALALQATAQTSKIRSVHRLEKKQPMLCRDALLQTPKPGKHRDVEERSLARHIVP